MADNSSQLLHPDINHVKTRRHDLPGHLNVEFLSQAGGKGSTGQERVLDVCPEQVHQRVPLFIGSKGEVDYLESFF